MNKLPHVAVLGATGAVGQEFIRLFEERNFSFASLKLWHLPNLPVKINGLW